jgi:hypothetical protein
MSPTINKAALSGTDFMSACISMTSTMDVSSTTSSRLLPDHPVTQVIILHRVEARAILGSAPDRRASALCSPARSLAEALIDHRFSLLLPPEFTRDLRVLDLSQSAASPGAVGRVLALVDAFEPELL